MASSTALSCLISSSLRDDVLFFFCAGAAGAAGAGSGAGLAAGVCVTDFAGDFVVLVGGVTVSVVRPPLSTSLTGLISLSVLGSVSLTGSLGALTGGFATLFTGGPSPLSPGRFFAVVSPPICPDFNVNLMLDY